MYFITQEVLPGFFAPCWTQGGPSWTDNLVEARRRMNSLDFALWRPTTVMVTMADVILRILFASNRMHADVFPDLNMPIIYDAQADGGITPGNEVSYEILFSGPV